MSWQDNITQPYTVTCGDGQTYTVKWKNPQYAREFNVASFNFPNVPGTFVDRQQARGRVFPIDWYIDGADHLVTAKAFDTSSLDRRPWTVQHPYYGTIIVHPSNLNYNNTRYNVTQITGNLLETTQTAYPQTTVDATTQTQRDVETTTTAIGNDFANNVTPQAADITTMQAQLATAYTAGNGLAQGPGAEAYRQAYNSALGAITNATSEPLAAINGIQQIILAPARFEASVQARFNLLKNNMTALLSNVTNLTLNNKFLLLANGSTTLTAMALALATPGADDYPTRSAVLNIISQYTTQYNNFMTALSAQQTADNSTPTSFIPGYNTLSNLDRLANFTLGNLLNIATTAKQQRSFVLEKDSN